MIQPRGKSGLRILKAGGDQITGNPTVSGLYEGNIILQGGHGHLIDQYVAAVIQVNGVFSVTGDAKSGIVSRVIRFIAPTDCVAAGRQDGSLGKCVADGGYIIGKHIAGDVNGASGGIMDLNKIQVFSVGCGAGPIAGKNLADDDTGHTVLRRIGTTHHADETQYHSK